MKSFSPLLIATGLAALGFTASRLAAAEPAPPATYPLSAYTATGSAFASTMHLGELGWTEAQFAAFVEGLRASYQGRALPMDEAAQRLWAETGRKIAARSNPSGTAAVAPGTPPPPFPADQLPAYMKATIRRLNLQESDSGLAYNIQPGRAGVRPAPTDTVVVSGVALAADGKTPIPQLSLDHVRMDLASTWPGFTEGLQMMTVDGQATFVFPPALTFGDGPWPEGLARGTPLIFRVTLHEIVAAPTPR